MSNFGDTTFGTGTFGGTASQPAPPAAVAGANTQTINPLLKDVYYPFAPVVPQFGKS